METRRCVTGVLVLLGWACAACGQSVPTLAMVDVDRVRPEAERGNAVAAYVLGTAYFHGRGVAQDNAAAVVWFERAAAQGIAFAQWHLGDLYADGTRVPQHDEFAFRWALAAALQGVAAAQNRLGELYLEGRGTAANAEEAAQWFEQSARQGHARAQYNLGLMVARGRGMAADTLRAFQWLSLAAAQGHRDAAHDRDALRPQLSEAELRQAQNHAVEFTPQEHFGLAEVKRQLEAIQAFAERY